MHRSWFRMEYFDDLASGQCADQLPVSGLPAIAVKNIHLTGVKAYCDEFPAAHRTTSHAFNSELVSNLLTTVLLKLFKLWSAILCYYSESRSCCYSTQV